MQLQPLNRVENNQHRQQFCRATNDGDIVEHRIRRNKKQPQNTAANLLSFTLLKTRTQVAGRSDKKVAQVT
jgi:hypothetical protein